MKKVLLMPVIVLLVMLVHPVFANGVGVDDGLPNDPNVNDQANACYDGGTLEGVCSVTDVNGDKEITQQDIDWMWTAGWYLIRYQYGLL
ncbi:MAG TPA: hypothetical protein VHL11_25050, partial [Phototrophicaceae bacterium]|nr:hypothetical protein [Phototrophicaceae bacterium]